MKKIVSLSLFLLLMGASCSKNSTGAPSISFGSDISKSGTITDTRLDFKFPAYTKDGEVKDLFNYLYFKGDTLCFSIQSDDILNADNLTVYFINPSTGERFKPERLDFFGTRAAGFSLVGSIMEQFFSSELSGPLPQDMYCCKDMPFELSVEIKKQKDTLRINKKSYFTIEYNSK